MKHWGGRDRPEAELQPLSPAERERVRALLQPPAHRRPERADMGSLIGLGLALAVLMALALMLAPGEPVSSKLLP